MKKLFLLIAALNVATIYAQSGLTCSAHKSRSATNERSATLDLYQIGLTEEYNVHFYFLDVAVENTSTDITGSVEIHAKSKVALLDTFLFELHEDLNISSILLNGVTPATFTRVNSAVFVDCNFTTGDNFYYQINYGGTPPNPMTNPLGGSGITNDDSPSWGNQVTWTLSEPYLAYEWFPCKQSLTDKADSSYTFITTSSPNKAGSNGLLTNVTDMGGGYFRYEWKSNYPIVYYLISLSVAEYVDYSLYANPTGAVTPILIQNYVYNNPGCLPYFQDEINNTADFIEYFSELYGMYPFEHEKYGHCMAPISGGMEHQTMTTQGWFEDGLTVHEMGHQWFGDNVTCASWSDIWLNEGFASYTEYLMWEHFSPGDELVDMNDRHNNIMEQPGGSVWVLDTLDEGAIFSGRLVYNKGAAIIHTLRFLIDDDNLFFQALRNYQVAFKDSSARASDFKNIVETTTGMNFTNYFNEWYYGEGYPTYSIEWNQINSNLFIELSQSVSMPGVTPFFTNDLELKITDAMSNIHYVRLTDVDAATTLHNIGVTYEVVSIEIDPNNWIINQEGIIIENENVIGISSINNDNLMLYPSVANEQINVSVAHATSYQIINSNGQVVMWGYLNEGKNILNTTQLATGLYLLKTNVGIEKFQKK